MLSLHCVMTENCNLQCSHCYMSAGPGKKDTTVTSENFQRMLSHLPVTATDMALTGGEIFTVEDQLKEYLSIIVQENEKRDYNKKIRATIQTNGFWLQRKDATRTLNYLKKMGIDSLAITSKDKYHREQGLKLGGKKIELAKEYISFVTFVGAKQAIMPMGRAKDYPANKMHYNVCQFANNAEYSVLVIRNNGGVYPCCFPIFRYQGSIFEEPLLAILNRAIANPRLNALNERGIRGIAAVDNLESEKVSGLCEKFANCGACAELYARKLEC